MPLVTTKQMLLDAQAGNYAVGLTISFEQEPQSALKRFTRMFWDSRRAKNLLWDDFHTY